MPTDPRTRPLQRVAVAIIVALLSGTAFANTLAAAEREDSGANLEHERESEFFRHLAGGEIDAARVREMWSESRAMPSEPARAEAVNSWQLAGPVFSVNPPGGFVTGRVRDIDPINIRALAASGGLWKFNIFGGIPMCDSVPASWFGSFATHPFDANTILLGTGEYHTGSGSGLYKTTDGGLTWTHKPMSPEPSTFSKVRWSADGATAYASSDNGLYRSTDGGENWTLTLTGQVSDFSVVTGATGLLFATKINLGVWRSADGGVTWGMLTTGGVPANIAGVGAVSGVSLPSGGVTIYVAFDTRIWRSTNGAASWTEVTPTNFGIGNSGYGPVISACPSNPQIVLYGNVPYCRSIDGGTNWTKIATPDLHADNHAFGWEANGTGVWAANDGGWSHSVDAGATWSSSSNAMPISQFYSIDCEKTELGYMIGGTQDNNILYTPNPSLNWIDPALGSTEGDATGAVIDLYNPQQMWAVSGVSGGPIAYPRYHTTDGGTTWSTVDNGIGVSGNGGSIRTDNASPALLVTSAAAFVYQSLDGGATWAQSNPSAFPTTVTSLTSSTRVAGGAVLYATMSTSAAGQRLYVRDNGTWIERSAGLPAGRVVLKVVPHPWAGSADEAWAILSGFGPKLFHTLNRGVTWTDVTGDFPVSMPVSDLVPNPRSTGVLFVGTVLGCYRSKNGGVNWEHWNNGMPPAAMVSEMSYIDLTSTTGQFFVVAATYGRSVWKRDVSGDDVFPTLDISNPVVAEGNAGAADTAWFRVSVPVAQSSAITVNFSTQDGTATLADNDYMAKSGTLTIPIGQTEQWIGVAVNGDLAVEPDETFQLVLSNPVRAVVGAPGTATIQDDDFHALVGSDLPVTDGTVSAIAVSGSAVYVGGSFSHVGLASGSAVPLDATTGLPTSLPRVDGSVNALAPDGTGGWYIGGNFLHVGGAPRSRLAHILADGSVTPWNPVANDYVFGLVASGDTVYVAGRFTSIAGIPRHYLAAVSSTTGLPTPWAPEPNDQASALALTGSTLYVGGYFTTIGGKPRNYLAAVNTVSGLASVWNPNANGPVGALLFDGGPLLVAGSFTTIGGQARNYLAALDLGSGAATAWNPAPDNVVFTLASNAGTVYAGGVFANLGGQPRTNLGAVDRTTGLATGWTPNPDGTVLALALGNGLMYVAGTFANIGGRALNNLAAVTTLSGLATSWNPDPNSSVVVLGVNGSSVFAAGVFTSLAAQPRGSLAAFDVSTRRLLPWNPNATGGSVLSLVADGGVVYAGGSFTSVDGQVRNRLAALDTVAGHATSWDPNASSTVRTMLVLGSKLYVGGSFTTMGGVARNFAAAFSTATGTLQSWIPNANAAVFSLATDGTLLYAGGTFTNIGGLARNGLASLSSTSGVANPAWNPNPNAPINYLMIQNTALFVCGSFTQIAGLPRTRFAVIDLSSNAVSTWNPAPNNLVFAIAPSGLSQYYIAGSFTAIGGQARNHLALVRPSTNQVSTWAPEPDDNVNALALSGSVLYAGGNFNEFGGLPQSHLACVIPASLVDAPPLLPVTALALRLSPNPTLGPVRIEYDLPVAARVSIAVYDVQGRRVGPAFEGHQAAGTHSTAWNGPTTRAISAGIYFVRFEAGTQTLVKRMVRL